MRVLPTSLLAGIAAAVLGLSGAASAQTPPIHVMSVALPGGGVAEIRYAGDVPPRVVVSDVPFAGGAPIASVFGPGSPFAMIERISAEMDRQAAAMFRQAEAMAAQARSGPLTEAAMRTLPPGSQSYTYVSTLSGNGACTQSVEITRTGNGPPRVVSHSSGDCAPASGGSGSVNLPVAPLRPVKQPDLLMTNANGAGPYTGMVRQVAANPR